MKQLYNYYSTVNLLFSVILVLILVIFETSRVFFSKFLTIKDNQKIITLINSCGRPWITQRLVVSFVVIIR